MESRQPYTYVALNPWKRSERAITGQGPHRKLMLRGAGTSMMIVTWSPEQMDKIAPPKLLVNGALGHFTLAHLVREKIVWWGFEDSFTFECALAIL